MILAPNERLVKQWNYANVQGGKDHFQYILSVTNKRVVTEQIGRLSHKKKEIRVQDVSSVHASSKKQSPVFAMIVFGLALVMLLVALTAPQNEDTSIMFFVLAAVLAVVGLILFVKRSCTIEVRICVDKLMTPSLMITKDAIKTKAKAKKSPATEVVKVKVDKAIANEIVEELGCLILTKKYEKKNEK